MMTLTLQARQDHLERDAQVRDPVKGIAEIIWNSLDADANDVRVELVKNDLGGITAIRIVDDGHGITKERAGHDFGNLGDSAKRKMVRTRTHERAVHGKEGRGRLKFFSIARQAKWSTVYEDGGQRYAITMTVHANNLDRCEVSDPEPITAPAGTTVDLTWLKEPFDALGGAEAFLQISTIFAPYLLQYPGVRIGYNGFDADPRRPGDKSASATRQQSPDSTMLPSHWDQPEIVGPLAVDIPATSMRGNRHSSSRMQEPHIVIE